MSKAATNFPLYLPNYQDGYADRFESRDGNYSAMRLARNYTNSGSIIIPDSVREFKERGWEDTRPIQYPLIAEVVFVHYDFTPDLDQIRAILSHKSQWDRFNCS